MGTRPLKKHPKPPCILAEQIYGNGYGMTTVNGRTDLSHRLAWEEVYGPIPLGYEIHHRCGNRGCIKVAHLELVTHRQHVGIHHKCEHGDEFRFTMPSGVSRCRKCAHARYVKYRNAGKLAKTAVKG